MAGYTIGSSDVQAVKVGPGAGLFLIAGPCVIESPDLCLRVAEELKGICERLKIGFVFKASFDKANRTSLGSFRGPGLEEGLKILADVRRQMQVPVLTDIHLPEQAAPAAEVLDILQIPAFLCRQTDLLTAAARTGKTVQVKKAQFLAPHDMKHVVGKLTAAGAKKILLAERGSSFGYNRLVCDMTAIPQMQQFGYPVVLDATHSTQQPGGAGDKSGGSAEMAKVLARAGIAAGADGLFIETHPQPDQALSDAASMIPMDEMESVLSICHEMYQCLRR